VNQKLLLTGRPGSGKTTLIKRVVNDLAQPAGGFFTQELHEAGAPIHPISISAHKAGATTSELSS